MPFESFRSRLVASALILLFAVLGLAGGGATLTAQTLESAHMIDVAHGDLVAGAGTLRRSDQTLDVRLALSGLDSRAAYTVWWVIWNSPELCQDGCGVDDLFITDNSIYYAAGFVAGADGIANLQISTSAGFIPAGVESLTGPRGLYRNNGNDAEVHVVVRTHGPLQIGSVHEQLFSFDADCSPSICFDQYAIPFVVADGGGH